MRIGILAPEQSGKSSYLAALHAVLTEKAATNAYPIRFKLNDPNQQKRLDGYVRNLVLERGQMRFPPKTNAITDYKYAASLTADGSVEEELEIVDYPGGFIRGADEKDIAEQRDLIASLQRCDGLIILLDAQHLIEAAEDGDDYTLGYRTAAGDVADLLRRCAQSHLVNNTRSVAWSIPMVFCITKFDKYADVAVSFSVAPAIKETDDGANPPLLLAVKKVRELFSAFFEPVPKGSLEKKDYLTMITAVSLGHGIENNGRFKPFNLLSSLEFCIGFAAGQKQAIFGGEADEHMSGKNRNRQKAQERREMGPLDTISDFLDTFEFGSD